MRIVRADGADCATGEVGEIWMRSPALMQGYWRNPEATAAVFSKATWIQGCIQAVWGVPEETISMHPVAWAIMASLPMALHTQRTARASPQP
mgnify:CR=1 FL=1